MKPQIFALLTAAAWGIGGFFEKKGLHQGNLSPEIGITIRTFIALLILSFVSFKFWKDIPKTDGKALLMIVIGGGVVAGALGMLFFYKAIKGAPLNQVMPIAFTSPLFGILIASFYGGEPLSVKTIIGTILTICGIIVLTI
jgi:transporter family protein